ncbi:MAG: peroxide stress protein YaaA [Ktedonobacterales bacterium]
MATSLSDTVYAQLCGARRAVLTGIQSEPGLLTDAFTKNRALVDGPDFGGHANSGRYLPALERYTGNLYAVPGLRAKLYASVADRNAPRVLILSALYGPLHPLSPIQDYNLRMDQVPARIWRTAFLPMLDQYVSTQGIRSIVLLVGSETAYYRVASRTASDLLRRGRITEASQYHILDGNTRATPVEHGRILLDLLSGRPPSSTRTERRSIDGVQRAVPYRSPTVTVNVPTPAPNAASPRNVPAPEASPRMRRAPPPNASATEVARVAARNMLIVTNATSAQGPIAQPRVGSTPPTIPQQAMTTATPSQPARILAPIQALSIAGRSAHRTHFDELMRRLMTGTDQGLPLARLLDGGRLPDRGVYFFLYPTTSNEQDQWRICRVGTHAVSLGSKSTLRARLRAHLGTRSGSGNHRGSIFRLHVGNALLRRDQREIATWGFGSVAPPALRMSEVLREAEARHEQQVSNYIGQLPVLWVAVSDEASPASERSIIERNAIALLSRDAQSNAVSPNGWLGEHSPRSEIRESRLWNLNYVDDDYDPNFLTVLERAVAHTLASDSHP